MAKPVIKKSGRDYELEAQLRRVESMFERRGVVVRREKLSAGHAFKVKSGDCYFSGENLIFVDRRLPIEQQLSVLLEYLVEAEFHLDETELALLPEHARGMLLARQVGHAA